MKAFTRRAHQPLLRDCGAGGDAPPSSANAGFRRWPPAPLLRPATEARQSRPGFFAWSLVFGVSGFLALSLEIVWFRLLGVMVKSTAFTFGTLLAVYLAGLGAGAVAGTRYAGRVRRTRVGIDLDRIVTSYLVELGRFTPAFKRAALLDFNTDLFPKDEFDRPAPPWDPATAPKP